MPFRFLHTADLHLDSPLKSLALRDPALAGMIGGATREALVRIVDICIAERVDALLIAGDLYDGDQTSMKTARFLAQQLQRLDARGIPTFVIRGNHDAMSRITRELVLPPSVHVFGARPEVRMIERAGRPVAIHGISFAKPQAPDSLLRRFADPVAGAVNIGMMHTSLGGAPGHDVYAPCALAELQGTGFDYWALGHIHMRAVYPGRSTVVMPGMPQGRDIGESGAKTATLVTIAPDGAVSLDHRGIARAQFERVEVSLDGLEDIAEVPRALKAALGAARRAHEAEVLVLRPVLTGATPLHWRLRRDPDLLREQAALEAEAIGSVWIDKVELALRPARDGAAPEGGALDELARIVADQVLTAPGLPAQALEVLEDMVAALPRALRDQFGTTPEAMAAVAAGLLRDGAGDVLAHLRGGHGESDARGGGG